MPHARPLKKKEEALPPSLAKPMIQNQMNNCVLTLCNNGIDADCCVDSSNSCTLVLFFVFSGVSERWRRCEQRRKVRAHSLFIMYDNIRKITQMVNSTASNHKHNRTSAVGHMYLCLPDTRGSAVPF